MPKDWDTHLEQWTAAGLIDSMLAGRIREWERGREPSHGLRWPTYAALAFGAILVAAGILLFVSAHWDEMAPYSRMALVVLMVAVFHIGGAAAAQRFEGLSIALHAVGTITLGAAIALTGQIFNLDEHWPSAVLMWAAGAALAWALLRQWPQAALTALLVPAWLASEWSVRMLDVGVISPTPVYVGICALSLTYLSARRLPGDSAIRRALQWIGGIALLPSAIILAAGHWSRSPEAASQFLGWSVAILLPVAAALLLRGPAAVWNLGAVAWAAVLGFAGGASGDHVLVYAWCAAGAIGLAVWGIREARAERINLAMAGFAITVLCFYFSDVMDKLGRSASLVIMGLLFLGGGWLLERTRRGLLARIRVEAQ